MRTNKIKKTYTKQQMCEALKYWTNVLIESESLDESSSVLLDKLADDLGSDNVFNMTRKVILTDNDIKNIFNSLNRHVFSSKLKPVPVYYYSYQKILNVMRSKDIPENELPNDEVLGVHLCICNKDNEEIDEDTLLSFDDNIIMINKDIMHNRTFIFNVTTICHEMIHYYDTKYGDYSDLYKKCVINGMKFSGHYTQTFAQFINLLYSYGLRVLPFKYSKNDQLEHDTVTQMASTIYDEQVDESEIDNMHKTDTIVSNIRNERTVIVEVDYD